MNKASGVEYGKKPFTVALLFIVAAYLALAVGTLLTKQPWCDEAWVVSPVLNIISEEQRPETPLTDFFAGLPFSREISEYSYRNMPFGVLAKIVWFKFFGFDVFSTRTFSILWGFLALASCFAIVNVLSECKKTALLAVAFIAVDYNFIFGASDGRLDMMTVALGFTGLASYLLLRERNLSAAFPVGHTFVMLGGLTHPNGILPLAGLIFISLYFDYGRIKLKHVLLSFAPYMVGGAGFAWYVAQNPEAFFYQFTAMSKTSPGSFYESFKAEILGRYLGSFGFRADPFVKVSALSSALSKLKILTLIGYVIGVIGLIAVRDLRRNRKLLALFVVTLLYFLIMAFFIGNKRFFYLAYVTPLYAACLAVFTMWAWKTRFLPRWALGFLLGGFMLLQVGGDIHRIKKDHNHKIYLPMMTALKNTADKDDIIMGSPELGFGLEFSKNFRDDFRLGFHTGIRPDIIVTEARYRAVLERKLKSEEPDVYRHVTDLLNNEFKQVYVNDYYKIYARK